MSCALLCGSATALSGTLAVASLDLVVTDARFIFLLKLLAGRAGGLSMAQPVSLWPAALRAALAFSLRLPCPVFAHVLQAFFI